MQIQCPHCAKRLKLDRPKPGLYQPNCKRCGRPFFVHVSADDPPRAEVSAQRTVAPSSPAEASPRERDEPLTPAPSRLGGYRIVRMLGRGAMGAVYQARQISLDRDVALKTIRGRLADNPASLARFIREAYAAAQLSHHNIVQIYDFGEEDGQHYFSMEWVRGGSLGDLVREKGAIDPRLAASYILQAARGLQYAHRNGMVHRDIKPANLLLGEDGVVKLADLGLVKVPDQIDPDVRGERITYSGIQSGTEVTLQGTAVGTPAYMAPEQGSDASTVDHRADIYSLGCSLFYLLAGRSPYEGSQASEVIEQHAHAPLPDLAEINARVLKPLRDIVARAMAKRPGDRYESVAGMIDDLQSFLGVESISGFSPRSEQADRWEAIVERFHRSGAKHHLAGPSLIAAALGGVLLTGVFAWASPPLTLAGPIFFVVATVSAIALGATIARSVLVDRVREFVGTLSWIEIGITASVLLLAVVAVAVGGLGWGVLAGAVLGLVAGVGYHFAVDRPAETAGREALDEARRFLRDLRLEGADETKLRDFLARYAGKRWQGIYEALFGYDALTAARRRLARDPSFDAPLGGDGFRDRLCRALARRAEANRQAANRKKLAGLERRSLLSQGLSDAEAAERSWQVAQAIMDLSRPDHEVSFSINPKDEWSLARAKRMRTLALLADAQSGRYKRPRDRLAPLRLAFSGYTRMLAGTLLLAIFLFAARASGWTDQIVAGIHGDPIDWRSLLQSDATSDALGTAVPIWSLGAAGVLMCLSAFVSGWRMTPFAVVATAVILLGPGWGVPPVTLPGIGVAAAWMVAVAAGLLVYLPGVIYGETSDDD
jgi:serine/threonine protein kinase